MDLDLRLLAQVRLESRQRYMALVIHFLTIPLYDVMTLVASGSHQPGRGWETGSNHREAGLRRLLQTRGCLHGGRKRGASGASRAPLGPSLSPGRPFGIGRSAHGTRLIGVKSHSPSPGWWNW